MSPAYKALRAASLLLAAVITAIAAEFAMSNCAYLIYDRRDDTGIELAEAYSGEYEIDGGAGFLVFPEANTVDFTGVNSEAHCLSFDLELVDPEEYGEARLTDVSLLLSYPSDPNSFYPAAARKIALGGKTVHCEINIPGGHTAESIRLCFSSIKTFAQVSGVTLNPSFGFSFSPARFALVLAVILLVLLCAAFKEKLLYDPQKKSHLALAAGIVVFCTAAAVISAVFFTGGETRQTAYPLENDIGGYNPYIQQFDAFMKGRLSLDIEPSAELSALENPYDKEARDGIPYLWDRAFYKGEYFSYFGIAPILTVYFPWYLVTKALPSDRAVMGIFSVLTALFFSLSVVKWVTVFKKKLPLPLLALGTSAALLATNLFMLQRGRAAFYYIALVASAAFISMFAYLALAAFSCKKSGPRCFLMVLCSAAFSLAFLSRINTVLCAAAMIAAAVAVYVTQSRKNGLSPRRVLGELCCLAAPVGITLAGTLVYNFLRFDNPLEFGTTYQLTVSDVSRNSIYLAGFLPALYHYFYQPLSSTEFFPYLAPGTLTLNDYGREYVYVDSNFGIFSMPLSLFSVLVPTLSRGKKTIYERAVIYTGAVAVVITAFLDFCLGGVIFRYVGDISFPTAFICVVTAFEIYILFGESKRIPKPVTALVRGGVALVFVLTIIIGAALAVSITANLTDLNAQTYVGLSELFDILA